MITMYTTDTNLVFAKAVEISRYAPIPIGCSLIAPPPLEGTQVARLSGISWEILPEYPAPITPPVPVPTVVTMRQARLALLAAGLLPNVDTAIAALPEPKKSAAKIEWEYSQEVQRHNGFVGVLAPVLELTADQIDALFIAAGAL